MRRRIAALLVAGVMVVASCGGGGDDGDADGGSTTSAPDDTSEVPVSSTGPDGGGTSEGVGIGEQVDLGDGLLVEVVSVEATELAANTPGEIAGPGVIVTVEVTNTTGDDVDLVGFVVNARSGDGDGAPASPNPTSGEALVGTLAEGASLTGTYAFRVPPDERNTIVVEIEHALYSGVAVVTVGDAVT